MGLWNGRVTRGVALFFFLVEGECIGESLSWENSIKYDQILLISLSNFRIYGIKKVEFLLFWRLR